MTVPVVTVPVVIVLAVPVVVETVLVVMQLEQRTGHFWLTESWSHRGASKGAKHSVGSAFPLPVNVVVVPVDVIVVTVVAVTLVAVPVVAVPVVAVRLVVVVVEVVQLLQRAGQASEIRTAVVQSSAVNFAQPTGSSSPLHSGISTQVPHVTGHFVRALTPVFPSTAQSLAEVTQGAWSGTPLQSPVVVGVVEVAVVEVAVLEVIVTEVSVAEVLETVVAVVVVAVVGHVSHRTGHFSRAAMPISPGNVHSPLSN